MTDAPTGYIRLNIKDTELQFHIKKSTRLGKLMDAYSARLGLQSSQIRFMVNGKCIVPNDTVQKLRLKDEDLIDVALRAVPERGHALADLMAELRDAGRSRTGRKRSSLPTARDRPRSRSSNRPHRPRGVPRKSTAGAGYRDHRKAGTLLPVPKSSAVFLDYPHIPRCGDGEFQVLDLRETPASSSSSFSDELYPGESFLD